jgi:hypothetical protein
LLYKINILNPFLNISNKKKDWQEIGHLCRVSL